MAFRPTETCPEPNVYRNPETGETFRIEGYGTMQDVAEYLLGLDIDWCAPIWEQVYNPDGSLKDDSKEQSQAA